ncbi:MAG TPA: DnaB-like helicase C-terminal domain-containing protein [Pseudoneobacillus sp.]|nr:DnaB-like helicase C-terminal domain-containing protein [Pseudoneobacillus sp.]
MSTEINKNNLNPIRSVYSVLGILCNKPKLVRNPEMPLDEGDFAQKFHKNIFAAINNIAYSDSKIEKITAVDVDNYLAQYPANYKIWEQHNGYEYLHSCIENANTDTYTSNYWRLKKFSLLRDYVETGIDVTTIYDYTTTDLAQQEKEMKALDKLKLDQIVEHFSLKMLKLRDKWQLGSDKKAFMAGDGMDDLLDRLREDPEFGYPFSNGFYNAIFRGMRQKKFMLRSAGTGVGKTRLSLADMCSVACDRSWNYEKKGYVSNGPAYPVLFISTELEQQELQTGMLAHISGVDEDVIKNGRYSKEVEQRLIEGIKIIKRAPIHAVYIADFSISDIETIIEQYIIEHGVKFVAFDYIQLVPKLARTMQEAFAGSLREDQILVQLSSALKLLANKYDVYIVSSTQVNRQAKDHEMRDTNSLRGGSATADKVDHGVMVFRVTAKDLDNLKHVLERGFNNKKPNFCHYVYKNRGGRTGFIIWTQYHGGVIREEVLFVTDNDFNLISNLEQVNVEFSENEEVDEEQELKHKQFIDDHMEEIPEEFDY